MDVYLKTHPRLDEIEQKKVCSIMDSLSRAVVLAWLHASQNQRLPLQDVLRAIYYDQLKLTSCMSSAHLVRARPMEALARRRAWAMAMLLLATNGWSTQRRKVGVLRWWRPARSRPEEGGSS